jgi:iron complex outermembrane receptor protein
MDFGKQNFRRVPAAILEQWLLTASQTAHQVIRFARACCAAGFLSCLPVMPAAQAAAQQDDLIDMSLEALMNIEVTSVSKRAQKKSEAAAAIFVITNEDLRRWGVSNIPDALRRVPGLQVARIDANKWAITARGFNSRFANKLLVLIDGRSVYTPLFAGVYWEANDVMLEDVERIEVIRGPGGTLWGANAVNGVINIITRSSSDTQGTLLAGGAGNEEKGLVNLRHGGSTPDGRNYRVYGKFHAVDTGEPIEFGFPTAAHDDSEFGQGGFRTDWDRGNSDSFTLQGDAYNGHADQQLLLATSATPVIDNANYEGNNLLYRWLHRSSERSSLAVQAYYDYAGLDSAVLFEDRRTLDLDFQHHYTTSGTHDLVWGLNYRNISDDSESRSSFSLVPAKRTVNLYTAFIQDEISLLDDRAQLTLGSKFEQNDFSGFEAQPNVRLTWLSESGAMLWGAVSRAVRTPARGEHDVTLAVIPPSPAPPPLTIYGNDQFDAEDLVAHELGYRFTPVDRISFDLAVFYNRYKHLRTVEITSMPPAFEATFDNNMEGNTKGLEIDTHWQTSQWLSVNANYTWMEIDLDLINNSGDTLSQGAEDASPTHQANLWLAADLGHDIDLDAGLRYVDSIHTPGMTTGIPSYLAFDARIGWQPRPDLELSLIGQNLSDDSHPEFNPDFIFSLPTEVERSIYGKVTLKF